MGRRAHDVSGKRFGSLTVIGRATTVDKQHSATWRCKCDCGAEVAVFGSHLVHGRTRSCGCLRAKTFINNLHEGRRRAIERRRKAAAQAAALAAAEAGQAAAREPASVSDGEKTWNGISDAMTTLASLFGYGAPAGAA